MKPSVTLRAESRNSRDLSAPASRGSIPSRKAAHWRTQVQRPPWTTEDSIRAECTSCGACISKCPEAILVPGPAETPTLDFSLGACTFCGDCAEACDEAVFAPIETSPWSIVAEIGPDCFLENGISCRSCTDACIDNAITFDLRTGSFGAVRMQPENCTGCGACVSICPASAISLGEPKLQETNA